MSYTHLKQLESAFYNELLAQGVRIEPDTLEAISLRTNEQVETLLRDEIAEQIHKLMLSDKRQTEVVFSFTFHPERPEGNRRIMTTEKWDEQVDKSFVALHREDIIDIVKELLAGYPKPFGMLFDFRPAAGLDYEPIFADDIYDPTGMTMSVTMPDGHVIDGPTPTMVFFKVLDKIGIKRLVEKRINSIIYARNFRPKQDGYLFLSIGSYKVIANDCAYVNSLKLQRLARKLRLGIKVRLENDRFWNSDDNRFEWHSIY